MTDPKAKDADLGELRTIAETPAQEAIPTAELRAYYRTEAARFWLEAYSVESIEVRMALLEMADRLERLANT